MKELDVLRCNMVKGSYLSGSNVRIYKKGIPPRMSRAGNGYRVNYWVFYDTILRNASHYDWHLSCEGVAK